MNDLEKKYKGISVFIDGCRATDYFFDKTYDERLSCDVKEFAKAIYTFATSSKSIEEIESEFPDANFGTILKCYGYGVKSVVNSIENGLKTRLHNNIIEALLLPDSDMQGIAALPKEFKDKDGKLTSVAISYFQNAKKSGKEKIELLKEMLSAPKPKFELQEETEIGITQILERDIFELIEELQ